MGKMRRNVEERIIELDLGSCQYALGLISKNVPFSVALLSAEKYQKEQEAQE